MVGSKRTWKRTACSTHGCSTAWRTDPRVALLEWGVIPYLRPGDLVEARIRSADGIIDLGVQRNRIV